MHAFASNGVAQISVVIPVYRIGAILEKLYERLCLVLEREGLPFEIIFVDDASPDKSLSMLEKISKADKRVAVLVLGKNVGQHKAVLAGLHHARGNWVVVMDGDLQDPPEAIPTLVKKMQEGYCAVFAGRKGQYESYLRLFTSKLFKWFLHFLCAVPRDAGLFVVMDRRMVERLLAFDQNSPFITAMIGCTGLPLTSIQILRSRRPCGKSAYNFLGRIRSGWRAIMWICLWKLRN